MINKSIDENNNITELINNKIKDFLENAGFFKDSSKMNVFIIMQAETAEMEDFEILISVLRNIPKQSVFPYIYTFCTYNETTPDNSIINKIKTVLLKLNEYANNQTNESIVIMGARQQNNRLANASYIHKNRCDIISLITYMKLINDGSNILNGNILSFGTASVNEFIESFWYSTLRNSLSSIEQIKDTLYDDDSDKFIGLIEERLNRMTENLLDNSVLFAMKYESSTGNSLEYFIKEYYKNIDRISPDKLADEIMADMKMMKSDEATIQKISKVLFEITNNNSINNANNDGQLYLEKQKEKIFELYKKVFDILQDKLEEKLDNYRQRLIDWENLNAEINNILIKNGITQLNIPALLDPKEINMLAQEWVTSNPDFLDKICDTLGHKLNSVYYSIKELLDIIGIDTAFHILEEKSSPYILEYEPSKEDEHILISDNAKTKIIEDIKTKLYQSATTMEISGINDIKILIKKRPIISNISFMKD